MTYGEFVRQLREKRGVALDKAHDTSLPARYRENFAHRAEVYEEILDLADEVTGVDGGGEDE